MSEIVGYVGNVYIQNTAASVTFTGEACTELLTTRFKITDATKRYWDDSATVRVYVDGDEVTTGWTIEYCGGQIVFDTSKTGKTVTVSGKYFTVEEGAGFFNWKVSLDRTELDTSKFGSGWSTYNMGKAKWTATAGKFFYDDEILDRIGDRMIFVFFTDEDNDDRYEGYGYLKSDTIDANSEDNIKEDVGITGDGKIYFHE